VTAVQNETANRTGAEDAMRGTAIRAEIETRLKQKPFAPFRISLVSGTSYEIRDPKLTILGPAAIVIGIASVNHAEPEYPEYSLSVRFVEIRGIEPLTPIAVGRP